MAKRRSLGGFITIRNRENITGAPLREANPTFARANQLRSLLGIDPIRFRRGGRGNAFIQNPVNLVERLQTSLFGSAEGGLSQPGFEDNPFAEGIENIRESRESQISEGFEEALQSQLARLEDRGLGGSSFGLTAALGTERAEQGARSELAGDIGELQIAGVQAGLEQQRAAQQQRFQFLRSLLGGVF